MENFFLLQLSLSFLSIQIFCSVFLFRLSIGLSLSPVLFLVSVLRCSIYLSSLSVSVFLTLYFYFSIDVYLILKHPHKNTLTCTNTPSHTHTLSLSLSLSHTHTQTKKTFFFLYFLNMVFSAAIFCSQLFAIKKSAQFKKFCPDKKSHCGRNSGMPGFRK